MEAGRGGRLLGSNGGRRAIQHGVCILLALLGLVFTQLFTRWAHGPSPAGLFETTKDNVSQVFSIEITMDRWARYIDTSVPAVCLICLCLSFVMVFNRNASGPVCCNPEVHPPLFYLTWLVICLTDIGGLLLWDRGEILQALYMRLLHPALAFYMLSVSFNNLQQHRTLLHSTQTTADLTWFTYYATQNSLALSAWWTLTSALVHLGVVFKYTLGLQDPLVSTLILSFLFLAMLLWFILDNFLARNYIRYTFTVYPILILGLGAMFTRGYLINDMTLNIIYCGFLMIIATVMNGVALFSLCCGSRYSSTTQHHKQPLPSPSPTLEQCPSICQSVAMENTSNGQLNYKF